MFYSQFILAKKGPLGTIWIAAHLERKLRKNQVADTDIGDSVDSILFPEVPIALRLSSHLLLGVVRIYSKKVNYLFDDCSEALLKVKQAFRSAAVDLPPEQSKAPYHSITLPETFDLDDFELPDNEMFQGNFVDHHVSTREQITLQDTMDGVSFPASQFGPDERFGDGDASQIGLDLDEELFMDKGDGAGTSEILVRTSVDPLASTKDFSKSKGNELDEEVSNHPLDTSTNYFSIQAPSTPGLMEEPNLPSAKEDIQFSDEHMDYHMDEDHNASELTAKEVSGTASSPMEPSDLATFTEHLEATSDHNNVGIILENEITTAVDVQSKGCFDADHVVAPVAENAIVVELQGCDPYAGCNKIDVSGTYNPTVQGTAEAVKSAPHFKNSFQPCVNLQKAETCVSNIEEKSSGFATPVMQACTSKLLSASDGVDNVFDSSNFSAQEDGSSFGTAGREGTMNACGISSYVGDELKSTTKDDQVTHGVSSATDSHLEGSLNNLITEENHFEKENNLELSNFPPPELLLSMPNLPSGPSNNFVVDSTPVREVFAKDGDAIDENLRSGRKRSSSESTLTIQSLNSVESSGGAESKGTLECVPDDNDLLSSILVGRSTGFKMKPTPPIPDTVPAKRQKTSVRSVVKKRKVLLDDSTVLHGDLIRQQLTNTEDIRRVRKKAPCTHLEVWVLQKQFLEDEIFSESVFTGMFPAVRSLDSEAFDLHGIKLLRDDRNKEASEADISARPTLGEETEATGPLVPSTADMSTGPKVTEKTEDVGTTTSSVAEAEGTQMSGKSLLETPCEQETSVVNVSTLLEVTQKADNDSMIEMSHLDICEEKASMEFDDRRISVGGEPMQSVASWTVPESSVGCVSEVDCNSTDHANVHLTSISKSGDVAMFVHDDSGQLLDLRSPIHCTIGDVSTEEDVSGSGTRDQGLDVGVSGKVDLDERSAGEHILDGREGFDTNLVAGHAQDCCSLPDHDSRACAKTDQVEECHLYGVAISNKDENIDSGRRPDVSYLTLNNIDDTVTLDSSFSVEMNLSSQKTTLIEMEGPPYWEDDSKIVMDSTPILTELIDTGNNAEFGTGVIEHDTDFLNVDDDDVEDYEGDMPEPKEKHILDNSGWSSRTRAVANYLQVLFEEYDQAKRVVSLDNLLVGKTRKEASRMFFETLVLKTKDYIQIEQETSFCDIKLNPRGKLLKSEFGSHT